MLIDHFFDFPAKLLKIIIVQARSTKMHIYKGPYI